MSSREARKDNLSLFMSLIKFHRIKNKNKKKIWGILLETVLLIKDFTLTTFWDFLASFSLWNKFPAIIILYKCFLNQMSR